MSDLMMREMRNAEALIAAALKEKEKKDRKLAQFLHLRYMGNYKEYGLFTIVSIVTTVITLLLAIFVSGYFLLILPVIFFIDRYIDVRKKRKFYRSKLEYIKSIEVKESDLDLS